MDPSFRSGSRSPCSIPHHHQHHRHHHHHHHHPLCHHHQHHHGYHLCCQHRHHHRFNFYSHVCPRLGSQPPQNPEPILSYPLQKGCRLHANANKETSASMTQVSQEPECEVLENDVEEEEEDGDVVFVLTDEWREFFAKSEAKRRLEKQQAKKKEKH